MEIGISTACFYPLYTEETINIISDLGCGLCEVFLEAEYEYDKDYINILKKKMNAFNMRAGSVHAFCATFEHQLFSEYERRRTDALKVFEKVLIACTIIGAKNYTFHGDKRCDDLSMLDFGHYLKCLDDLINLSAQYDVNLSWENVAWCQTSRPEFIKIVRQHSPALKFTLDIKQARRAGIPPEEYIKAMGAGLTNVHVNDYNQASTCLLPGEGEHDFARLFCRLRDMGYRGNAIIEVYSSDYSSYAQLKKAMEYLKGCIQH